MTTIPDFERLLIALIVCALVDGYVPRDHLVRSVVNRAESLGLKVDGLTVHALLDEAVWLIPDLIPLIEADRQDANTEQNK